MWMERLSRILLQVEFDFFDNSGEDLEDLEAQKVFYRIHDKSEIKTSLIFVACSTSNLE